MFKRLRKSALKRLAAVSWRYPRQVIRCENALWLLDRRNFVDRQLGVFGGFETEQRQRLFSGLSGQADMFIDVGANFGLYTVDAALRGVARDIYAFEPDPRNRAQLHANLYLNDLTQRVEVRPEAVSDHAGEVYLSLHPDTSTGTTRLTHKEDPSAIVMRSLALDDLFTCEGKTILIKVDIEGHEMAALRGMVEMLRKNACFMQVEVFEKNTAAVDAFLKEQRYTQVGRIESDSYYAPVGI